MQKKDRLAAYKKMEEENKIYLQRFHDSWFDCHSALGCSKMGIPWKKEVEDRV